MAETDILGLFRDLHELNQGRVVTLRELDEALGGSVAVEEIEAALDGHIQAVRYPWSRTILTRDGLTIWEPILTQGAVA